MSDMPMDVLAAGYQDIDAAQKDFDGLVALAKDGKVHVDGVIVVAHGKDGKVTIANTGDHLGR
ncbi:MAG TPA: hypothetical protein VII98_00490, partial [Solirubrobacteraceae bacterium]